MLLFALFFPCVGVCQQKPAILQLLSTGTEVSEHNPDSALLIFEQALALANGGDTVYLPKVFNRLAQVYSMKGDYSKAAHYSFASLKKATLLKDTMALIDANNNLGIDFMYQEDYASALNYFNTVEHLATLSSDSLRLGHALNNIGLTLGYSDNTKNEMAYYERAATIFKAIGELEGYANTLLNKATVLTVERKFSKAEDLYNEALQIFCELNYTNAQSMVLQSLAENESEAGQYRQGLTYAKRALQLSEANGFKAEEENSLILVSKMFEKLKQYDSAHFYLKKHIELTREIFNIEKNRITSELDEKYQTEIKEKQITELQQANTIKDLAATSARQRQVFLLIGLVLLLVSVFVLYKRYQLKQRTARELDSKNAELQKLNSFKDRMFAVISHDLRNPVHAFSTLMESLHQNAHLASKEELQEFLNSTLQSARDLQSLLNNLLEWALVQIGRLPFQPTKILLQEVVQESVHHTELMALQKKITITSTVQHHTAFADKSMLVIVVRNLLTNAIKFSSQGATVEIHASQSTNRVQLTVRDHGPGMQPEELVRLFKQNESTRNIGSSSEKGIGIGLLLCSELMEKNNGKIWAESTPEMGSTFYLELPLA
jgi:two-component system, sensor histidine kinase and response regulator